MPCDPAAMIAHFASTHHFKSYDEERDPSLSANANALHALALSSSSQAPDISAIQKLVVFLADRWSGSDRPAEDKWVSIMAGL